LKISQDITFMITMVNILEHVEDTWQNWYSISRI